MNDLAGMDPNEITDENGRITRGRVVLKNGAVYEG